MASLVCLQKKFVYLFTYNTFFGDFFCRCIKNKLDGSASIT